MEPTRDQVREYLARYEAVDQIRWAEAKKRTPSELLRRSQETLAWLIQHGGEARPADDLDFPMRLGRLQKAWLERNPRRP